MSQYNRDKNPFNWRSEIATDLDAIRRELDQLRRIRFPQANENRDIRWAMTVGTVPSTYPNSDANTFPIRFLDAHFTKSAGLRTFTYFNRSTDPVTIAHAATGQYIPPALPLPVFWQRGLGGEGKGEWWFLDPPRLYVVKLTSILSYRGVATAEIWLPDALFALYDSNITITVRDVGLQPGETRAIGTQLLAHWYLTPYPHWIVDPPSQLGLAIATLRYDMCGYIAYIEDFRYLSGEEIDEEDEPTTADNNDFHHKGMTGDRVLLTWSAIRNAWIVINVTKHDHSLIVGTRRTGDCIDFGCIEELVVSAAIEVCTPPVWRTVWCFPPCQDQTSVETSTVQTSFVSTSAGPQTSSSGCGDGEINPDLIDESGNLIIGTAGDVTVSVRQIDVTVTEAVDPCEQPAFSPPERFDPNVNPRSNTLYMPLGATNYRGVLLYPISYDSSQPSTYQQGIYETYSLRCTQRYDILEGGALSEDPNDKEWVLEGTWGISTLGGGTGVAGTVTISETQGAISSSSPGTIDPVPIPGSLTILSFNPFHAIAQFTPLERYPDPWDARSCGPVQVEFTEV